ncbi:MAG: hypothetical protein ACLGGV_06760 [Bacteroidia bacterium]
MNASELKYNIFELISSINDEKLLKSIYNSLASTNKSDWWMELSESQKMTIEKGLTDVKNGKVKSHARVLSELRDYVNNG